MHVTVWTDTDKVRYGDYFTRLLRRLGYRTDLRIVTVGYEYFDAIGNPRNHPQIGMNGWLADYPAPATFFDPRFRCDSPENPSRFCVRALDRMVADALSLSGPEAETAWARAERRLTDLAPAVPLVSRRRAVFASTRAGNVQQNPFLGTLLERVWVR
jgi:peptide/nickel transport system substrate-binding protein